MNSVAILQEAWQARDLRAGLSTSLDLIVDGGTENHALVVEDFLATPGTSVHKMIALKDLQFSNSMIESCNIC